MITVKRKGVDVFVTYTEETGQKRVASAFCKNVEAAQELASEVREAIKLGYGFAKCIAILEGDTVRQHGGTRPGAGRPSLPEDEVRKARSVKFSDAEWEQVKKKAQTSKMNISEYIRNNVLKEEEEMLKTYKMRDGLTGAFSPISRA
jgi:hypothetical protein